VLDTLIATAGRLCNAEMVNVLRRDGEVYREAAALGLTPEYRTFLETQPLAPGRGTLTGRVALEGRVVHIADITADPDYTLSEAASLGKIRSMLGVPLLREGSPIGVIILSRTRVEPFTERQIELVRIFADQAVIAIENARLITETQEALEQQTATAEVLQVINSSPGDLAPVFEAMLDKAMHLCGAAFGILWTYDGEWLQAAAIHGATAQYTEFLTAAPHRPGLDNAHGRLLRGERLVHIADAEADAAYLSDDPIRRATVELGGARTVLAVPLRKDGVFLGDIVIYRKDVQLFSEKQIALLENFAAQAVIAMENARLITETREALEQQTATAEVLGVINSSPGDLAPVFEAILDKAHNLCGATLGSLFLFDGELFRAAATHGYPQDLARHLREGVVLSAAPQLLDDSVRWVHNPDLTLIHTPTARAVSGRGGVRANLMLPLRKDGRLLGAISCNRQEVRPFTDKEIALLENFAAQAVIAIENARLLTETREALERQTATAEILRVISSSPTDVQPTFDAIAKAATTLTGALSGGVFRYDGSLIHFVAHYGWTADQLAAVHRVFPIPPGRGSITARAIMTRKVAHVADFTADPDFAHPSLSQGGLNTTLSVPMLRDGEPIGAITITRTEKELFGDEQVDLLKTFADQAVIAIENVRLFNELNERTRDLEESLEYQTATSDVLKVISQSGAELEPVLETLVETAARICDADKAVLGHIRDGLYRMGASIGFTREYKDYRARNPITLDRGTAIGRMAIERRVVHIEDASSDPEYTDVDARQLGRFRTVLSVPLFREGAVVGGLFLARSRVEPFSEKQIELVTTFADQAVIAIENARLLTELRESLEQQTATSEVLGVINSSTGDLAPVFDAMLEKAMRLCDAAFGQLAVFEDGRFRTAATRGMPEAFVEYRRTNPPDYGPGTQPARLLAGERIIHIADMRAEEVYAKGEPNRRALVDLGGVRTSLMVPLLRDDAVLGFINFYRQEVRPFSDKQIALLQNFAGQAVIAMENARLLDEIRQRQAELHVTFENMGDGVAMFDPELRLAAWNRNFQRILDLPDALLVERPSYADYIRILAERGEFGTDDIEAELSRRLEDTDQELRLERTRPDGRIIEVRRNAVPGGGFVLIYGDVTERKRSEEAIRAARDAAEAALHELKTAQASLIHAEKMASLGQLTAGIAHEIKNPLNFVNNFAGLSVELLEELKETTRPAIAGLADDERADVDEIVAMLTGNLEKIAEHGRRADGIVKSMLEHSRGGSGERRNVDLNSLVEEALNLAYHGARAQDQSFNITLERDLNHALAPVELVPQDMTRVFLNLFGNGFYAANKRQRDGVESNFRPVLKVMTNDLGDTVEIRIRDNGTGILPEIRDKLFQPFFTTKPTGEGTGLGLSISWDIVTQQHGGTIEVDSRVGEFTEFTIHLPRFRQAATAVNSTRTRAAGN
jgi:GAF domain-containing protein